MITEIKDHLSQISILGNLNNSYQLTVFRRDNIFDEQIIVWSCVLDMHKHLFEKVTRYAWIIWNWNDLTLKQKHFLRQENWLKPY